MKGTPQSEAARRPRSEGAKRFIAAALLTGVFLFAFALSSSAHEPITTKVRFNKEVIRIFQRSCLGCHRPGGIAFSLATYDEARPWAKAIKEEVLEKRMPPWHAVKGYGEFRNAPSITQRDIDLLVNWVEGGAPKGEDKDLPEGPLFSDDWQLGKPDLVLKPESESTLAADAEEYRTFILPTHLKEDRRLIAIDLLPGNGAIVHCAKYRFPSDIEAEAAPMMHVRGETAMPSDLEMREPPLATWVPGQRPLTFGDGVAQLVRAGSRVAVTIHYRGSGETSKDSTQIGLYFAKTSPARLLHWRLVTGPDSVIPVGDQPREFKLSTAFQSDVELIGILPEVNPLIISFQATAYRPDGSQEVLIWTRGYEFDWEPTYVLRKPVALPKGSRIEVIVYFANSNHNQYNPNNPARPLRFSELTLDPWCVFLLASADQ